MNRALRVLHIVSGDLWAGAEVQACTLMSHLARMPDTEVAAILMNEGRLALRLRAAGIRVIVVDEKKLNSFRILVRLHALLVKLRPDLIHTHREKENILGSLANRFCHDVPSIRTVHGGVEHQVATRWQAVRRRIVVRVDRWCGQTLQQRLIAVSSELGMGLAGEFGREKVIVVKNGVDVDTVRAESGVAEFRAAAPECVHVGIVGRLERVKRVDLFIESAAILRQEQPHVDWRFHVFGDGPLRPALEKRSQDLALTNRVQFHGHRQDIATSIAGLDVLVICSDHEGMPMTALEAAALEVPTVAHAVGGLVDVVPKALLVERHDARGYCDGISRALEFDMKTVSRRQAKLVQQTFSAQSNAKQVRTLYEQVIAERNARR